MRAELQGFATEIVFGAGVIVWVAILLAVACVLLFGAVPAFFRWCCYVGFIAMADKAKKAEARAIGRRNAEIRRPKP